jgi:hypothetical protein
MCRVIEESRVAAKAVLQRAQGTKKVGVGHRVCRIPIWVGREAFVEKVQAAQFFEFECGRGKSSDLGRAEETRRERRVASVLELDVQAAVHIVLMVCFGRFHAVYVDCRRTSNRPNCGEERAPCNASYLTKDRRNVLGREVIENTI